MNNDLISREALKKELNRLRWTEENGFKNRFVLDDIIDNAPTVEENWRFYYEHGYAQAKKDFARPTGGWIPVSERLPKEEDYRPCWGLPDGCVMWQTDNGDIGFGWYYDSTKCWSDIYDHPIKTGKVIAWQPLPEPYKKGGAE